MGVDIYGINPVVVSKKPVEINWDSTTDEEKEAYFDAYNKWEEENPGAYFRSNWWGWRPITMLCLLAQNKYNLPLKIESWDYNDGAGLKSAEDCNILADALQKFLDDDLSIALKDDDDKIQICLGSWVSMDGKFISKEISNELDNTFPVGTILFTPIVMPDGLVIESAHSTPLWLYRKWIDFVRNSGGFEIH